MAGIIAQAPKMAMVTGSFPAIIWGRMKLKITKNEKAIPRSDESPKKRPVRRTSITKSAKRRRS